jgi:N-acetylglutamate synthase-like GNAT family acetyltransferase
MLVLKYLPNGNILAEPNSEKELEAIFNLRWEVLRKDWNLPRGSEQDEIELQSIHRLISTDETLSTVMACGRIQKSINEAEAQIRYMAVAANHQRKGLGNIILSSLEDVAKTEGIQSIFLNARENALDFYKNAGYQIENEINPFLGIRHFRMLKSL